MKWNTIQLGDYIEVKHGFPFEGRFFSDSGKYICLTPGNCHETGGLKLRIGKEKFYTAQIPMDYLLGTGDLLVVMTDLVNTAPILGGAFLIPEDDRFLHNQRLGLVTIKEPHRIDKQFLYYVLNSHSYRGQVRGSASGATVRHTSPNRILACRVMAPVDLDEQRRIGETLSAYDDLIDNNRRRIQLLEESARLLYKEWFVHLRFPGHEHVTLTAGVPQGWEKKKLGDVLTLKRGYDLPSATRRNGDIPVISSSGITGFHSEKKADAPGVVTGRYGTLGEVYFIERDYWPLNTSLYVKDFKGHSAYFILHVLKHELGSIQSDKAAIPGLDRNVLHERPIIYAPLRWRDQFTEMVEPLYRQLGVLKTTNAKLTRARDLLLPRLMSGELAA
jgi:type I restriction enzyme, S subunit